MKNTITISADGNSSEYAVNRIVAIAYRPGEPIYFNYDDPKLGDIGGIKVPVGMIGYEALQALFAERGDVIEAMEKQTTYIVERESTFTFPQSETSPFAGRTVKASVRLNPDYPDACGMPFYIKVDDAFFVVEPTGWRIAEHEGQAVVPVFVDHRKE